MIAKKKLIDGQYVPDLPEGTEYESCVLNPDSETYTVSGITTWGPAPYEITQLQGKLQLSAMGLFDTIEEVVEKAGPPTKIYWQTASTWRRTSPILLGLSKKIGMSENALDHFFINAAKIR